MLFFLHDASGDAVTGKVDGDFSQNISKNAGAFSAMTVTITERAGGWYLLPLSAAHTDTLGILTIYLTVTGGELTTFRLMAHDALAEARRLLPDLRPARREARLRCRA